MGRCLIVKFSLGLIMYKERQDKLLTERREEKQTSQVHVKAKMRDIPYLFLNDQGYFLRQLHVFI